MEHGIQHVIFNDGLMKSMLGISPKKSALKKSMDKPPHNCFFEIEPTKPWETHRDWASNSEMLHHQMGKYWP